MAVNIHLLRQGRKKAPHYRIVVADSRAPRDGRFIEIVGYYNPLKDDELYIDLEKVEKWVSKGARPTNTVSKLLKRFKESELVGNKENE